MVIWLLGISGSGKSTLGRALKNHFDNKNINSYIIDGDIIRNFYENDLGYSKKDREANIKRILLSAYILEQNNIVPIVCNISPFEYLRDFARKKFHNYIEIYLKRDINNIKNKKIVYEDENVVGVDIEFEEPQKSNLIIDTNMLSEKESLTHIIEYLQLNK